MAWLSNYQLRNSKTRLKRVFLKLIVYVNVKVKMTKKLYFSISDLAKEFDVTTRTIRFYEEKGLLTPKRQGGSRIYSAADRVKLKLILRGKRLGLSLDEGREIIEMYQPEGNNAEQIESLIIKIRQKKQSLIEQLRDIEVMLEDLTNWDDKLQQALLDANDVNKGTQHARSKK